jgi:hypothetical protein
MPGRRRERADTPDVSRDGGGGTDRLGSLAAVFLRPGNRSRSPCSSTRCAATARRTSTPAWSRLPPWASRAWSSPATTTTRAELPSCASGSTRWAEGGRDAHRPRNAPGGRPPGHCRLPPGDRLPVPGGARQPRVHRPEQSKALADTFNQLAEKLKPRSAWPAGTTTTPPSSRRTATRRTGTCSPSARQGGHPAAGLRLDDAAGHDPVGVHPKVPGPDADRALQADGARGRHRQEGDPRAGLGGLGRGVRRVRTVGGTEWVVLEQETYPDGKTPMESVADSLAGLRAVVG